MALSSYWALRFFPSVCFCAEMRPNQRMALDPDGDSMIKLFVLKLGSPFPFKFFKIYAKTSLMSSNSVQFVYNQNEFYYGRDYPPKPVFR
jgi:hypothetical protein